MLCVTFNTQEESTWFDLVSTIEEGLSGALLQDAFDPFGEAAGDALQEILDETEDIYWRLAAGHIQQGRVHLEFEAPIFDPEFTEQLCDWLRLCGAKDLRLAEDDS